MNRTAAYHARCWATERTAAEIRTEITRCEYDALHHTYQWNEVGSADHTYSRADTLKEILIEREQA
jgi:hypothetical protein